MREPYVHEAVVAQPPGDDVNALGAAVTVALCGHWEHEPPCPLAPHHTSAERRNGDTYVRVLFAAEPADEERVRQKIEAALAAGAGWELRDAGPSRLDPHEAEHAARLARG
jgi:hypothetical protein